MALFRLDENAQSKFAKAPEIFANIQFCQFNQKYLLIVGSRVGIEFDAMTPSELGEFYNEVWAEHPPTGLEGSPPGSEDAPISSVIVQRYERWINSLHEIKGAEPYLISRNDLSLFVASVFPPPPPGRPLTPRYPPPPTLPQNYYGHGAIVPNFGQSGGGVEVYFPTRVTSNGPIANPVVIPPL